MLSDQEKLTEHDATIGEAAALCDGPLSTNRVCEMVWVEQGAHLNHNRLPHQALPFLQRAWDARRQRLGEDHADTLELASMVAWAQAESGELATGRALGEKVYQAYQRIYTQPTDTSLRATLRLSRLYKRSNQQDRAVELVDEYIRNARKLYGDDNPNTTLGLSDRASLLFGKGRFDDAAAQFTEVARAYRKGGSELNGFIVDGFEGDALREAGRPADALPLQRAEVEFMRAHYPKGQHVMLARALVGLGLSEAATKDFGAALRALDEGLAMHRALKTDDTAIANARALRGKVLFDSGKRDEGLAELRGALDEMKDAREGAPNQYWEPFALLTSAACERGASDCATLQETCANALKLSLAATTRARLEAAVSRE